MPVWINPFTGEPMESASPPYGSPYLARPRGVDIYQGDPSDVGGVALVETGQGRGRYYYGDGDEWAVIQSAQDVGRLQDALEATVGISGSYIRGLPDAATASALKRVMAIANSTGLTWEEVLRQGLVSAEDAAAVRRAGGGGGGSGGGGLAITDEDIKALANKVAQSVIGRNLRDEEIGSFIPAFRGGISTGTSPQVVAENTIRTQDTRIEAGAHDAANVMQVFAKMLGG